MALNSQNAHWRHLKEIAVGCQATEIVLLIVIESLTAQLIKDLYGATFEQVPDLEKKESARIQQNAGDYLNRIAVDFRREGLVVRTEVIKSEANQGAAEP